MEAPAAHLPEHTFAPHLPLQMRSACSTSLSRTNTCARVAPMDRRRKLSELPASRCQARELVQGTSPVEMKTMREEILSRCKSPQSTACEERKPSLALWRPSRYSRSPGCSSLGKIAGFFMRPDCLARTQQASIGSLAVFLTQVFGDLLERGIKTLTEHHVVAVFLYECVSAEIVFMNRT